MNNMKLVFATNNPNKLKEVRELLPNSIELLSLKDINCLEDIAETGKTLQENALIKAAYIYENYGYNCFSDDTGLEVTALNNEPGVYSARYAGENANSKDNMEKLLCNLAPKKNRTAQFRTSIVLYLNGEKYFFEGICKGEILLAKQGGKGFGYDPIFKPEGSNQSFAEMTSLDKSTISHRGKALHKLLGFLKNYPSSL